MNSSQRKILQLPLALIGLHGRVRRGSVCLAYTESWTEQLLFELNNSSLNSDFSHSKSRMKILLEKFLENLV